MNESIERVGTDVLVVGSEGAGARAAIEVDAQGRKAILTTKGIFGGSGVTLMAPFSCCVAFGHEDPRDNPDVHFEDTVIGGKFLNNQELVKVFVKESPRYILDLESYGAKFEKREDNKFVQAIMPGHRYARAVYYNFSTGLQFRRGLKREVKRREIPVWEDFFVINILVSDGRVSGALCLNIRTGKLVVVECQAVILATGGNLELYYPHNDGSCDVTGDGSAIALRAGAELVDMEFQGKDVHDVVEWIAQQPWCDGNVGMIGISFLANMQVYGAIEQPPHLKAIFPEGGHYDPYETAFQGGIMWLMPRAAMEGRGGDSAMPVRNKFSIMKNTLSKEEFERRIEERLADPDIKNYPNYHQILIYPDSNPMWLDFLLNPYDGPFWWGSEAPKNFSRIKSPAHFGAQWGRGWVTDGTIARFLDAEGPKRLVLRPPPPMQERPFHQFHDEIIRWYDHWLKGKDTGVMDNPPIKLFVQGVNEWRYENEWPLARTKWTKFYLRSRHRLLPEPEPFDTESVPPDGFYQPPLFVTNRVQSLTYRTPAFPEDKEITGPIGLYLHAVIDTDDTNWIIRIFDVDPPGNKIQITTGWLKASQNELDQAKSKPWAPHHPHKRSIPVKPGEMNEYAIRVYAMSNVFKKGHCMELEIRNQEDPFDPLLGVLPPDAFHLNSARPTFHKIYRDKTHPSHLLLPIIPRGDGSSC